MSKNKVEITGISTSNIKVLSPSEMKMLFTKLKNGDTSVRDAIALGNLKLVLSVLKNYQNRVDNMDDLFQIGCVGLMKAIDNFDLSHEVMFSTYAVPLILGEIRRYIRDNSNIRISRSIKDLSYKIMKIKEEYYIEHGTEIPINLLADKLGVEEIEIIVAMEAMKDPISMSEPIYQDGGDTIYLEDQIENKKDRYSTWDNNILLNEAINNLKDKEKQIIKERYIIGKTQIEIAEEIGISQAQVSRLEKGGLDNMRKKFM